MTDSSAERKTCVSIFDRNNPDSVYSRMPESGKFAMDSIPSYLKAWSFKKLEKTFSHNLTTRDRIWKIAFWREYQSALDSDKTMSPKAICRGVCPEEYMYEHIFKKNPLFAWILYPMPSYENAMLEMLDLSTRRLREVLALPILLDGKRVDHKLISLQVKIHELVENRVRGIAPQTLNINQKSLNMNVNQNSSLSAIGDDEDLSRLSLEEINGRLSALHKKVRKLPRDPGDPPPKKLSEKRKKKIDGDDYIDVDVVSEEEAKKIDL